MKSLDLHGYRLHEAEDAVLKFVDRLYARGEACGRIIHGHGVIAGELERWLRAYPFVAQVEHDPAKHVVQIVNSATTVVSSKLTLIEGQRAGRAFPSEPIRTLAAIHLATALEFLKAFPDLSVLSFDVRIRNNCEALGMALS